MRNVKHGTPIHGGPSLCESCRHATRVQGLAENDGFTICGELPRPYDRITFKVRECSTYDDRRTTPLWAMREVAWSLMTDKTGRRIGFLSPQEAKARKDELADEPSVINPFTGGRDY